jgi:hypothetical protein
MTTVDTELERAALIEALANMCARAKREFAVVGTPLRPTPWDRRHHALNDLLDLLEHTDQ